MKKEQPSPLKPDNSIDMQAEEELSSSDNMLEAAEGVEIEKKLCHEVYADGTLSEPKDVKEVEVYQSVPEGYSQIVYHDNGYRTLFAVKALKDLGYLILENSEYALVKVIPETGEEVSLADQLKTLEAYNSMYFLTIEYNEGWKWYLTDRETLEKKMKRGSIFMKKFLSGQGRGV